MRTDCYCDTVVDKQNFTNVLKWLRQYGERGSDWDFIGGLKKLDVYIYTDKLKTAYILKYKFGK